MVAFYPHFVSCGEKATLRDVVGEFIYITNMRFKDVYLKVEFLIFLNEKKNKNNFLGKLKKMLEKIIRKLQKYAHRP